MSEQDISVTQEPENDEVFLEKDSRFPPPPYPGARFIYIGDNMEAEKPKVVYQSDDNIIQWTYFLAPSPEKLLNPNNDFNIGDADYGLLADPKNNISLWINYRATAKLVKSYTTYTDSIDNPDEIRYQIEMFDFYIFSPWDSMKNAQNQVIEWMNQNYPDRDETDEINEGIKVAYSNKWDFESIIRVPTLA